MSTTETQVKVTVTVILNAEESEELRLQAYWIKTPTKIVETLLRYTYEGKHRGWVLGSGRQFFHRVKKNGELYQEMQDTGLWTTSVPEKVADKYRPTSIPVVTWVDNE